MNVLINVPRLNKPGGVANFYLVLRSYLDSAKEYYEIGSKPDESGILTMCRRMLVDYWRFHSALSSGRFATAHLNPSLVPKAVIRDAIFLLIARAHSVPVLVFFRGWDQQFQAKLAHRFCWWFRTVFNRSAGIVVLAKEFETQLREMGIGVPVFQLSTCVDDSVFTTEIPDKRRYANARILFLSRLDYGKGVVEVVRTFSLLKESCPGISLTIAGDGPERSIAEQTATDLGLSDICFLGHVQGKEKARAFLESDIFFFPSYGEGMPNAVLEAMAYGLPVITRPVGGLKDFFQHERMGFLTESTEPKDFSPLLEILIKKPELRHKIGQHNRQYARENFAASQVARRLDEIYVQIDS